MSVGKFIVAVVEDFSIGAQKLASNAVETAKLALGAVTTEKIADDAVTADKIAAEAVGLAEIDEVLDLMTRQLPVRAPVRAATTANVADFTTAAPLILDGVTLQIDDRVLVKNQSSSPQNGLYAVTVPGSGANGTWVRSEDANTDGDLFESIEVYVQEGSTNANSSWRLQSPGTIDIGVDNQNWNLVTSLSSTRRVDTDDPLDGGGELSADLTLIWNPQSDIAFNQQEAVEFVIENRTSDPGSPVSGQIWLRTDL